MFEAITVKQNKIVEILKIKITIPLIDWEKDNITCFSANRELIHLTIYKDTLFNNLALNDEMHDHFFKLIVTIFLALLLSKIISICFLISDTFI